MHVRRLNSRGAINALLIGFITALIFLLVAVIFGLWAFAGRQDYKTNTDAKIKTAVNLAVTQAQTAKDSEYAQKEKEPLKEYNGPTAFGSLLIKYPKTWSAYVDETNGSIPVNAYFNPNFVPGLQSKNAFALRVQILNNHYEQYITQYDGNIKAGKLKAMAYRPANVPSVLGLRVDGQIVTDKKGSIVVLPLRDKVIVISTEADQFVKDFDDFVLKNLLFSP